MPSPRPLAVLGLGAVLLAPGLKAKADPPSPEAAFEQAIALLDSFEDEQAARQLHALLARAPPGQIAAKAHLYLGLIAFDALRPDEAKAEFRRALETDPAVEVPRRASPKSRLAFAEVRRQLVAELETNPQAPLPAPAAATSAPAPKAVHRSHTAAYVLGAVTVLLAAAAVYGGVDVINYNGMVNAGNAAAGTGRALPYSYDQVTSARGQAQVWAVAWPIAAGLGAAGAVATGLTW